MIKLSNDYEFTFCNGSGALGFDGKGWPWEYPFRWFGLLDPTKFTVVLKTLTLNPVKGNLNLWYPWQSVRLLTDKSCVNAVGLTNPGLTEWLDNYKVKYDYALSLKINSTGEAGIIAAILNDNYLLKSDQYPNMKYIEVNVSCPNSNNRIGDIQLALQELQKIEKPLVLKLSTDQINKEFIKSVEPYVEAFHAINTIPWDQFYPYRTSPLEKYKHKQKGGVSGKAIQLRALVSVRNLTYLTDKPIIGGGGIDSLECILRFKEEGAKAFSIGTCFLYQPWKPNQIIEEYNRLKE